MSVDIYWRLPLSGDGRSFRPDAWNRGDYSPHRSAPHPFARTGNQRDGYTYYDHLSQIARAAELTRFDGVWLPYSAGGEDPLIVAGALAREARRLTFVASLLAPLHSAVYVAKIANSFQRLTGGRLAWSFVTEPREDEPAWHGRRWTEEEQLDRTAELLTVAKGFWADRDKGFSYKGRYYEVEKGGFPPALQGAKLPRVFTSGTSEAALTLAAAHADVHLLPLEPIAELRPALAVATARAAAQGRALTFGVEATVVARHSDGEAWEELRRRGGQASGGPVERTLVGSYETVAEQIAEYARAGISTFVLSAHPHLEEAYLIGERVLPLIRARVADDEPGALRRSA
jgi:alkanesulfonate monooxygenase